MNTKRRIKFLEEVKKELRTIKRRATPQEKSQLDLSTFNFDDGDHCIYGQMTGDCYSNRAKHLMPKSYSQIFQPSAGVTDLNQRVNYKHLATKKGKSFTALEIYLFDNKSDHAKIIAYIKGEIKGFKWLK